MGDKSEKWWDEVVFYEVYVRSFADSNGDGIGDLQGLIGKLDYLESLGVDAVWLCPVYPSPLFDCGYDVADYTDIAPEYGTMEDFEGLLEEAQERGVRIIMDLVLNHTSDQHPWFQESRSSRRSAKRDWYVWRDGRNGGPPNNWESMFGGSAWEYDSRTDQYYYHMFFAQQPDLNWQNPDVKHAMFDVARFWLDKGVDGFRLDAISTLVEDENLTDSEEKMFTLERLKARMEGEPVDLEERLRILRHVINRPETHDVLKELREVVDEYPGRVLVGEVYLPPHEAARYYGDGDELHLVFNFSLLETAKLDAVRLREAVQVWEDQIRDEVWFANALSNHDRSRQFTSFGNGEDDEEIARVTAALTLTLRGIPFLYYGEEIGMEDLILDDVSQFKDNVGVWFYEKVLLGLFKMSPEEAVKWAARVTRDRARTPMQWSPSANGGFSEARPWLPVNPDYQVKNVSVEEADPESLLSFYRRLISTRRANPALLRGRYVAINEDAPDYLSFLRRDERQTCLVVLNMSDKEKTIRFDLNPHGISSRSARLLLSSHERCTGRDDLDKLSILPYEVYIAEVV